MLIGAPPSGPSGPRAGSSQTTPILVFITDGSGSASSMSARTTMRRDQPTALTNSTPAVRECAANPPANEEHGHEQASDCRLRRPRAQDSPPHQGQEPQADRPPPGTAPPRRLAYAAADRFAVGEGDMTTYGIWCRDLIEAGLIEPARED